MKHLFPRRWQDTLTWLESLPYLSRERVYELGFAALLLTGAIDRKTYRQEYRKMSSEFKHTIVAEASGPEGVYQRITFEQFYDSSSEQVENQERLFTSVVAGVTQAAMGHRDGNA